MAEIYFDPSEYVGELSDDCIVREITSRSIEHRVGLSFGTGLSLAETEIRELREAFNSEDALHFGILLERIEAREVGR